MVAYTNKQGGTHSAEMCALLWKIMTWCHHYHITLKARHITRQMGYRTTIVDTLGPAGHHIAQSSDLHRLLSSFHRDRPKSSRNLPKWNLSVVLNELTKAPMKDTDLKHLTLKTAFLLALASGKRRSEIHAWVANKVSNLGQSLLTS